MSQQRRVIECKKRVLETFLISKPGLVIKVLFQAQSGCEVRTRSLCLAKRNETFNSNNRHATKAVGLFSSVWLFHDGSTLLQVSYCLKLTGVGIFRSCSKAGKYIEG